jgi:hypothetical protein
MFSAKSGKVMLERVLLAAVFAISALCFASAQSGPRGEALALLTSFKKSYDERDAVAITKLFARGAIFFGTTMQKATTNSDEILEYFKASSARNPIASIDFENIEIFEIASNAFLFSGQNVFNSIRDGSKVSMAARYTIVVIKNEDGWRIAHFHSSRRP